MGKTVTVSIPSWVDEDEFRRCIDVFVEMLGGRIPAEELRRRLSIRPEDLAEDVADAEAFEAWRKPPRTGHEAHKLLDAQERRTTSIFKNSLI